MNDAMCPRVLILNADGGEVEREGETVLNIYQQRDGSLFLTDVDLTNRRCRYSEYIHISDYIYIFSDNSRTQLQNL